MSEKQWRALFELIDKVVNLKGLSTDEKRQLVQDKAKEYSAEGNIGEFWFYCDDEGLDEEDDDTV